eukprot:TRINITY_DN31082_c0_g1_i1.p1 TRINITY_DN31082_c0_g1~~TRINITY_DN31082_c0_g1_i1.p1  ORF type:complete len:338 (+),score=49.19 TRINITY_DN31082_c0_g1_i1:253-1266(+)
MVCSFRARAEGVCVDDPRYWSEDPFGKREFVTIRKQWKKVLLTWVWMELCTYVDSLGQARIQQQADYYLNGTIWRAVPDDKLQQNPMLTADDVALVRQSVVLRDEGHHLLPHIPPIWCDIMCTLATVAVWTRLMVVPGPRSLRWTVMRRLWLMMGFIRLFRGITIQGTVLPNPDLECEPTTPSQNVWLEALFVQALVATTCQDVLYSEHTCTILLMSYFWAYYCPAAPLRPLKSGEDRTMQNSLTRLAAYTYCAVACCIIIGSRFHYTDDVILGGLLCSLLFSCYHIALRAAPFHHGRFWRWIVAFESDSPDMQAWLCCATNVNGSELAFSSSLDLA